MPILRDMRDDASGVAPPIPYGRGRPAYSVGTGSSRPLHRTEGPYRKDVAMLETRTILNPLREGMRVARAPEPASIVIFGATGDLARRKLVPALYNLACDNYMPPVFNIIGFARRPRTDAEIREEYQKAVTEFSRQKIQNELWNSFSQNIFYVQSNLDDLTGYKHLKDELDRFDKE